MARVYSAAQERAAVHRFLSDCERRIDAASGILPFNRKCAHSVIGWILDQVNRLDDTASARAKITKRSVDALIALAGRKDQFIWDTELKGFGVKVTPAGNAVYVLQYRKGGRRAPTKRIKIGAHGAFTPDQAREEAARLSRVVATGGDPAAARAAEKVAPTVRVFSERFLAEHVDTKLKPRTRGEYRWMLDHVILAAIGDKRLRDVTPADATRLHHKQWATPYKANFSAAVASKMFNLAEKWGERPIGSNPFRGIERYPEKKRERMLSAAELGRLADALRGATCSPFAVAAIKLLVFTGARRDEVRTLQWDWIDFERGEARLPDSKTGPKTLHLPAPALAALPRIEGNPFVIAGRVSDKPLSTAGVELPWFAIRKAAGLDDVRLHDLRHAFASVAASSGQSLLIVGKMLGHSTPGITARYAHLQSDPVKAAVAAVAGEIAAAMQPRAGDATVARMRR